MDLYKLSEKNRLGEGTYGMVFKGKEKATGRDVAVKRAKSEVCVEEGLPCTVIREIGILQWINEEGEHVVQLENHFIEEGGDHSTFLVFEKHECDLKRFTEKNCSWVGGTKKRGLLRPQLIKHLMKEMVLGVELMHTQGMIHRDLKPQNILVTSNNLKKPIVRIADLGLARNPTLPVKAYTHEIMTLWYRAPEVLLGGNYTHQVDMWSVGCIFAELFQGRPLFHADCEIHQLIKIFEMLGVPHEGIWPGVTRLPNWHEYPNFRPGKLKETMMEFMGGDASALDLLSKMLHYDPAQRIHASEALQHPYFNGV